MCSVLILTYTPGRMNHSVSRETSIKVCFVTGLWVNHMCFPHKYHFNYFALRPHLNSQLFLGKAGEDRQAVYPPETERHLNHCQTLSICNTRAKLNQGNLPLFPYLRKQWDVIMKLQKPQLNHQPLSQQACFSSASLRSESKGVIVSRGKVTILSSKPPTPETASLSL